MQSKISNVFLGIFGGLILEILSGKVIFHAWHLFQFRGFGPMAGAIALIFISPNLQESKCDIRPFQYIIFVEKSKDVRNNREYPSYINDKVYLRLATTNIVAQILELDKIQFSEIPFNYHDSLVKIYTDSYYWKFAIDSIILNGQSQTLIIKPTGILDKVVGSVVDQTTMKPLLGVKIIVQDQTTFSDSSGSFTLQIPVDKQQIEYTVLATMQAFKPWQGHYTPATNKQLPIQLIK